MKFFDKQQKNNIASKAVTPMEKIFIKKFPEIDLTPERDIGKILKKYDVYIDAGNLKNVTNFLTNIPLLEREKFRNIINIMPAAKTEFCTIYNLIHDPEESVKKMMVLVAKDRLEEVSFDNLDIYAKYMKEKMEKELQNTIETLEKKIKKIEQPSSQQEKKVRFVL